MRYVHVVDGVLELYHCDSDGRKVSTVAILDHNREALEFANALSAAASWFRRVAKGQEKPGVAIGSMGRGNPRKGDEDGDADIPRSHES